ncbi:hypothetical protein GCWU000342_01552 [Shuttleworthella satelles DSM 14600]|uniref:Uncharacterized protein n=1 Tax=Shuttleworthella satelles DSM 14600 TaxID=626523 RepID=C4GC65_9FIRM|nr:hypothetical protein GCWU000342_01552 [Shuttleworthia satelles DSM 14600]
MQLVCAEGISIADRCRFPWLVQKPEKHEQESNFFINLWKIVNNLCYSIVPVGQCHGKTP